MENAYVPELTAMPQIFKIKFPEASDKKFSQVIKKVACMGEEAYRTEYTELGLDIDKIKPLLNPHVFTSDMSNDDLDEYSDMLTKILGRVIPSGYWKVLTPGQKRTKGSPAQRKLQYAVDKLSSMIHIIKEKIMEVEH